MAKVIGKPSADDVKRVAVAALVAALDDGKENARKNPRLTGVRAVATGAVLYSAGRAVLGGRRFIHDRMNGAEEEPQDEFEDEAADEDFEDEDEDEEPEPEPEAEEDEDFEDEEPEPEAEEDEDFEDEDDEPRSLASEPPVHPDSDEDEDEERKPRRRKRTPVKG